MTEFVKEMFKDVIENPVFDEKIVAQYFSRSYIQTVDNRKLDYTDFVNHIKKLKEKVSVQKVQFLNTAENGTSVFTKHIVKSVLRDNSNITHKVLAEFVIEDGKIETCDELTIMLEGSENEKNLGSEM